MTQQFPLSIITPVRNAVSYFEQTLKAVAAQTCKDFEYIVLDGASTDGTLKLIEQYKHIISYTHSRPDKGAVDAFNQGIGIARGEFIAFLSADDWLEPDMVERIVAAAKEKADVISFGLMEWQDKGGKLVPNAGYHDPDNGVFDIENALYAPCINRCFRRELFMRYGLLRPEEYGHFSDRELQLRFSLHSPAKVVIPNVLYHFRRHASSSTGNATAATIISSMACNRRVAGKYLGRELSPAQRQALIMWYGFSWVREVYFRLKSLQVNQALEVMLKGIVAHPAACVQNLFWPGMPRDYRRR